MEKLKAAIEVLKEYNDMDRRKFYKELEEHTGTKISKEDRINFDRFRYSNSDIFKNYTTFLNKE